jgi:assimilatory nitrate reductase catalytic subunit
MLDAEARPSPAARSAAEAPSPTPTAMRTTCPYCGVGCGVLAASDGAGAQISGDPAHPSNFGRLCSKGSALGETVGLDGRLLYPMRRTDRGLARVSWDAALTEIARGFAQIIERHGPDAVALYLSGQLLMEDYYVANKLMKGFIGSPNVDTNSRLCMASTVAGHKRAFGADTVPGCYEDLDEPDLIVLVGSNAA